MIVLPATVLLFAASLFVLPDASPSLFLYDKFITNDKRLQKTFTGKRIWITGASSGIGAELARQLYGHGANIIISGRREQELNKVHAICKRSHADHSKSSNSISVLPFDVTDTDERISDVVSTALEYYDGIDILILNAGSGQLSPALDDSFSTTRALMEVNFMGPVRLAMEVMKQERWGKYDESIDLTTPKQGHIVVTSSIASKMALPLGTSYAASKHAVHGYFSSLRSECKWLRIDLPCPGPIATDFQSNVLNGVTPSSSSSKEEEEDTSEAKMPVERCAKLILSGMMGPASIMQETWISRQPTLLFMFINQYFPNLSTAILGKIGPLRLKAYQAGLPLYRVSSWLQAAKMEKEEKAAREVKKLEREREPLIKSDL